MTIEAPVIRAEMNDWRALGGIDLGIVGDQYHTYGFHLGANRVPASDYSRWRDPQGSDGPYTNWDYACAGDFSHNHNETLRAYHRSVLARLRRGELSMICEFIGKPWADQPVYYWARWNGIQTLQLYTGAGHDKWSHISWYRSRANERAYLWKASPAPAPTPGVYLRRSWPSYMPWNHYFGLITGPVESHGGWYAIERADVKAIQQRLIVLGFAFTSGGIKITDPNSSWADGEFGYPSYQAVARWQRARYSAYTTRYGEVWSDDWARLFTY